MKLKQELQQLSHKLDKLRRKLAAAEQRRDQPIIQQAQHEIETISKHIDSMKSQSNQQLSSKASQITALAFNRELTKAEQADMGKLKKSVRGLMVVHPMTALGKEIGVKKMTGFAPKKF